MRTIVGLSILVAALAWSPSARAQACVCSRNVALPSGNVPRAWAGIFTLDYNASLSGQTSLWQGFAVKDLHGDSMAGMYMPPHLVHTVSLTAALGLPAHFSASTTLPYIITHHLGVSEMPGDVDANDVADADLTIRWGHTSTDKSTFYGFGAGSTFPTGHVEERSPVRSGRGVFGATGSASAGAKVTPKVGLAGQLSGSTGFGADAGGYRVGPTASFIGGARWSPRENGRLNLSAFGLERWTGKDMQDALVYENTGYLITDLSVAATYTVWERKLRSASLTARAQAPIVQTVGDPMYAENFAGGVALSVVAF